MNKIRLLQKLTKFDLRDEKMKDNLNTPQKEKYKRKNPVAFYDGGKLIFF